jgi:aminopeptidase N
MGARIPLRQRGLHDPGVDAFIFGAMENTGLNIFNSSMVLADPKTATDGAFASIDAVIDHEFCHDETGNWVVPRDWFQISFKEGLTVFRDQTYYADRYGKTLSQISNARMLRGGVFPYDSGAMTTRWSSNPTLIQTITTMSSPTPRVRR